MTPNTFTLLQQQIKKIYGEEKQIRKDLAAQEKKVKDLHSRLEGLAMTVDQLKSFQQQLKGSGGMRMPSKREASEMDSVEEEGNGNSLAQPYKNPRDGLPRHRYRFEVPLTGPGLENYDRTENISKIFGLELYTAKEWAFINNWLRQDQADSQSTKSVYLLRLTQAFNEEFGQDRTTITIRGCVQRIRVSGHLDGPMPDYTLEENIPLHISKLKSSSRCAKTPPAALITNTQAGVASPPTSPEEPIEISTEFLDECGVIVSIGEDNWFELRCHICGRNATTNNKFFKGWEGVCRHLMNSHTDLDIMEDEEDFDFVMRKCILRLVSSLEVADIENGQVEIEKIKKANSRADGGNLFESMKQVSAQHITYLKAPIKDNNKAADLQLDSYECSLCSRITKVEDTPEICQVCSWAVCSMCIEVGNFFEERTQHKCENAELMDMNSSVSAPPAASEFGRVHNRFATSQVSALLLRLEDCCPCTLSGHTCKAIICNKKELCLEEYHGMHCIHNCHIIKPTCPGAINSDHGCDKPPFRCSYEHDDVGGHRLAIAKHHDCETFEH